MKKILLFLFFIFSFSVSKAQWVTIPDPYFADWLNTHGYASCMNGNQMDTTCSDIVNEYTINIYSAYNITDITGIKYFSNLYNLTIQSGNITNVAQLPTNLSSCLLTYCGILNFSSPLPPNLESLTIRECPIVNIPQLPASLIYLNLSENYYLHSLPTLPLGLISLSCHDFSLDSLPDLPSTLLGLEAYSCSLDTLPSLPASLTGLNCRSNNIHTLPSLPSGLSSLICYSNPLGDLPSLPPTLQVLDCRSNGLSSLPILPNALTDLTCSSNPLFSLPTLPPLLQHLTCVGDSLYSLPALPSGLKTLECWCNHLSSIPALPSTLMQLRCWSNYLTSLPALPDTLWDLRCQYNSLIALPPLANTDLYYLHCDHNQITVIPPLPPGIFWISCSYNLVQTTPVFPQLGMFEIDFSYNQLNSVPMLPDSSLIVIILSNNPLLTCLPPIKAVLPSENGYWNFNISNTSITCLPNHIQHPSSYSSLAIDTMQLCGIFNTSGCEVAWNIEGDISLDIDNNCSTTIGDPELQGIKLKLFSGSTLLQQVYSQTGSYSFDTQLGTYTVNVDTANTPFMALCPSNNSNTSILTVVDSLDYNSDFRLVCKPGYDVGINSIVHSSGVFFPGDGSVISLSAGDFATAYNVHCNTVGLGGTIIASVSGPVNIISASSSANALSSVNGNIITWAINDFSILNFLNELNIYVTTQTTAIAGNQVCVGVSVAASSGIDYNTSNNLLSNCFTVVNSYDPNFKEVYPSNNFLTTDWLTFTIHFQNTGNAPAHNILLIDTLDANLDWSTFQLLAFSHENLTQVLQNGIVHFNFPNINLPDSISDEPNSHSFVQYRIKPNANLSMGISIQNSASIYFDFNTPILTNTTQNTFCNPIVPTNISESICAGDSYNFHGANLNTAGNYSATLNAINGCDSVVNLALTVLAPISNSISQSICNGEIFDFNGQQLSAAGNYSATLNAINGCDSVVNLALAVLAPISNSINESICSGEIFDFNGQQLSAAGNYSATLNAINGCDSVVNLSLDVLNVVSNSLTENICSGDIYNFNGVNLNSTGIYIDTISAVNTCDSIITLNLTVDNININILQIIDTLLVNTTGTVQWFDCNTNQLISGATQTVFVPTTSGIYAAIITEGGCMDTTACTQVFTYSNDFTIDHSLFTISPNPTDGSVTVQLSQSCVNCRMEISNTLGQILFSESINDKVERINLESFSAGVYFITLRSDKMSAVKKLVKQ